MSKRNSTYERKARDHYPTPFEPVDALFNALNPLALGTVYEPCPGRDGKLAMILEGKGIKVISAPYGADFLALTKLPPRVGCILTNPPFNIAYDIILHALALMQKSRHELDLVLLLPTDYDHAASRAHLFSHPCFAGQIKLRKRIVWFKPKPPKRAGPSEWHSWFVWSSPPRKFLPWVRYATWE